MVVAVDFDGTLFEDNFPDVGEPKWEVINKVKKLKENGNILILWTCREDENLKKAILKCQEVGLIFDYINENLPERKIIYNNDSRKIGADIYIDDKSLNINDFRILEKTIIKSKHTN